MPGGDAEAAGPDLDKPSGTVIASIETTPPNGQCSIATPPSLELCVSRCHRLDLTVTVLWLVTPLLATASLTIVCVAITTNQWLMTQENMANPNYNGTGDKEYLPKETVSGLWTLCYTNPGEEELYCSHIDYFPHEEYSPDPNDSTMAIPYTVTKSAAFFLLATILLLLGELSCLFGHFSRQRRLFTFISGVVFIISGLLMLIGLVMYISIFKAEIGGKLRPRSQLQPPIFTFKYGFSFILYVTGFVSTEVSGTCAVFLYIYWHQKEWRRKRNDFRRKLSSSAALLNMDATLPICRRHPQYTQPLYISSNNVRLLPPQPAQRFSPILQRRFYLDRDNGGTSDNETSSPPCLKHNPPLRQNRRVGTDDSSEEFPPPPFEAYHHDLVGFLPRDATTNTVSTSADVELDEEESLSLSHDHEFVAFDLDASPITVPPPSGVSRDPCDSRARRKDFSYDVLRRTTPV